MNEEFESVEKKEEDDGSVVGGIVMLVLIIAAAILLWCTNPSESDHFNKMHDVVTEAVAEQNRELRQSGIDGYYTAPFALNSAEYHSLGVASWTTVRYRGKTRLSSVGALGFVFPLFEIL
ncbi:MAG: hypothetical protein K2I26_06725 [Paramuribaculum sp.]|nr:hypothetical protein [Paramuribaculum sp.]